MRLILAKLLAAVTGVIILLTAALFALSRNG